MTTETVLSITAALLAVAAGIHLVRWMGRTADLRLSLFRPYRGESWPQGVQEDDTVHWRWDVPQRPAGSVAAICSRNFTRWSACAFTAAAYALQAFSCSAVILSAPFTPSRRASAAAGFSMPPPMRPPQPMPPIIGPYPAPAPGPPIIAQFSEPGP